MGDDEAPWTRWVAADEERRCCPVCDEEIAVMVLNPGYFDGRIGSAKRGVSPTGVGAIYNRSRHFRREPPQIQAQPCGHWLDVEYRVARMIRMRPA